MIVYQASGLVSLPDGMRLRLHPGQTTNFPPTLSGMALRKVQDKAARIKETEDFYCYWHEMVSK